MNKRKKKKEKRIARDLNMFNKIVHIVNQHLWKNKPAEECMKEIVDIIYKEGH